MQNDTVAIILVNYNGINDTLECIDSINQNDYFAKQIIVVDNDSKEDEASVIQEKYPEVHVIRSKTNGGFSYGNNIGIKYSISQGYKYILLLNNDTIIPDNFVSEMMGQYRKGEVIVPTIVYYTDPTSVWYAGGKINRWTGNATHNHIGESFKTDLSEDSYCEFATGCCILFSSDVIESIGYLDEEYFMYCEDTDYCIRMAKNNLAIRYVSSIKLKHKVSKSTQGDDSDFCVYYLTRNRIKMILKHKDYFHFTALPFTIFSRYIRMLQYLIRGKKSWKMFHKAIWDGMTNRSGQRI